jgi:hypothetical protein
MMSRPRTVHRCPNAETNRFYNHRSLSSNCQRQSAALISIWCARSTPHSPQKCNGSPTIPRTRKYIAQKKAGYSDEIRDEFVALDRKYRLYPVNDKEFVEGLQTAADWLVARNVLPEPVTVSDHLAKP